MNKFTFSYPTKVYFGEGSAEQAFSTELDKAGETVMLAFGGGSVKRFDCGKHIRWVKTSVDIDQDKSKGAKFDEKINSHTSFCSAASFSGCLRK